MPPAAILRPENPAPPKLLLLQVSRGERAPGIPVLHPCHEAGEVLTVQQRVALAWDGDEQLRE